MTAEPATEAGHEVAYYTWGWNQNGDNYWSVLQVHADGFQAVVLEGDALSEAKAKAIAMILNAPEPS